MDGWQGNMGNVMATVVERSLLSVPAPPFPWPRFVERRSILFRYPILYHRFTATQSHHTGHAAGIGRLEGLPVYFILVFGLAQYGIGVWQIRLAK